MKDKKKKIAENLKKYRELTGLQQKDVAEKLGIKSNTLSNWENEKNSVDIIMLFKLCDIYGVSIYDMYGEEQKNELTDFKCTLPEQTHIKKYRVLDERGKQTVDSILDIEYSRIVPTKPSKEAMTAEEIKRQKLEEYSRELDAEQKGRTLSVLRQSEENEKHAKSLA